MALLAYSNCRILPILTLGNSSQLCFKVLRNQSFAEQISSNIIKAKHFLYLKRVKGVVREKCENVYLVGLPRESDEKPL